MPHSPFTRIFGCVIVAGYALALLWPDDRAHVWGWYALFSLPVVIGLFTWSAVRGAPPFDENAFHRTLPPSDGYAFWKVLRIHLLILAGIALAVLGYCWIFNFGWASSLYGIVILTAPVWAWMAACGVAASLAHPGKLGNTCGYVAIFLVPPVSKFLLWPGDFPESAWWNDFNPLRTMVLTAASLYPLIWWLVAAKRRWKLGMVLGAATGVVMPGLYLYGDFVDVAGPHASSQIYGDPDRESKLTHVEVTRKAAIPPRGEWLAMEGLLEIKGLREGEFFIAAEGVRVRTAEALGIPKLAGGFRWPGTWEFSDHPSGIKISRPTPTFAGNLGEGRLGWGTRSIWKHLLSRVAEVETFSFGHPAGDLTTGPAIRMKQDDEHELSKEGYVGDLSTTTWTSVRAGVFRFEKAGEIDGATGGFCRLPGGGSVRFGPVEREGNLIRIQMDRFSAHLTRNERRGLNNGSDMLGVLPQSLWIIAVDESGRHAVALNGFWGGNSHRVFLGQRSRYQFDVSKLDGPQQAVIAERLENCRLHVFAPVWVGDLPSEIPPPR